MNKIFLLFLFLFAFKVVYPQRTGMERQTVILVQGFNNGSLSSFGSSTLINNTENIYFLNPAALNNFNSLSVGISYQTESKIKEAYVAGIGYSRIADGMPESFGIIYPYGRIGIGFGFGQIYNGKMDIGRIQVTTIENPDGTGESYLPVFETTINSYAITFSYSAKNIFEPDDKINLGLRINRNTLHFFEQLNLVGGSIATNMSEVKENIFCYSFALGLSYYKNITLERKLGIGLFFESAMEFSKNAKYNSNAVKVDPNPPNNGQIYTIISPNTNLIGSVPAKLTADFDYDLNDDLKILGGASWIFWNNSSEILHNQINFSGSAVYTVCENLNLSAGFFNSTRSYTSNDFNKYFGVNDKMNAVFLTAGINFKYCGFNGNLTFADGNLLSDAWRKQTMFKIGFGYCL